MRIIHLVLGKARLDRMNGVNKVAHNLAVHQHRNGHEVAIWGITPTPDHPGGKRPYTLELFQAAKHPFGVDRQLKRALQQLQETDACVHLHGGFIPVFYRVSRLLRAYRIPYVVCPHGALTPGAWEKSPWKKRVYFRLFESHLLKHAHTVQFLGRMQYDYVDQLVKVKGKALIPNGQNPEELMFSNTEMLKPWELVFSYLGRIDIVGKGLDVLVEGYAHYVRAGGRGFLWLIGDSDERPELEAMVKELGLASKVRFWGARFGEEKLSILANSQLFILNSRHEGLPTGVLEAAGIGLPCLLSTETNLAEDFAQHQAGIHLTINNATHIHYALENAETLWKSGELSNMGTRAKQLVAVKYNWDRIAQQTISMYQQ
ncbi:MAG: glycosyltransferase [Bacteroidota bacterium]